MSDKFKGFEPPTDENSIPVPEKWLDAIVFIQDIAEYKVVFCVCLHTARAIKANAPLGISKDEITQRTKMSEFEIARGIKLALQDGFVIYGNNGFVFNQEVA